MDLYSYFQPHHNSKLRSKPLRLQELGELEAAAAELKKSLKRAEIRCQSSEEEHPNNPIKKEHFAQIIVALDYVLESLQTLNTAHPGDDTSILEELLEERSNAPGWENWVIMLKRRLETEAIAEKNANS